MRPSYFNQFTHYTWYQAKYRALSFRFQCATFTASKDINFNHADISATVVRIGRKRSIERKKENEEKIEQQIKARKQNRTVRQAYDIFCKIDFAPF